jgi:hypothetical protein
MDIWTDLEPLRKNAALGIEQITYGVLWALNGGMPGRIVCTVKMLQASFQRDGSTLREHLEKLAKLTLIRLIARDRRRGTFLIDVLLPLPLHAEAMPDRQMQFALTWTDGVENLNSWMLEHADELPPPPRQTQPGPPDHGAGDALGANSRGDFPAANCGDFPTANSRGDFPVTRELPRVAGTSPRGLPRGDFPALENTAISAEKPGFPGRGDFPAGTSPRLFNVNDRALARFNGITETNVNDNVQRSTDSGRATGPVAVGEAVPVGADLLAAIQAAGSPQRQKGDLVARIRRLVADPGTKQWLFGFTADLMLVHGRGDRPDAGAIWGKLNAFLSDLAAWREAEKREGKVPVPLGAWLNSRVHEICREHGILTPRDRKTRRANTKN